MGEHLLLLGEGSLLSMLRVSLLLNSLPQMPPILVFVSSSHAPSLKALFSLEAAPPCKLLLPPERQWPGKRWLLAVLCRDLGRAWDGQCRGIWKSYSTWINLSAKAALSYQAKGVPSNGGRRQSRRQGTGEGERQTRTTCH